MVGASSCAAVGTPLVRWFIGETCGSPPSLTLRNRVLSYEWSPCGVAGSICVKRYVETPPVRHIYPSFPALGPALCTDSSTIMIATTNTTTTTTTPVSTKKKQPTTKKIKMKIKTPGTRLPKKQYQTTPTHREPPPPRLLHRCPSGLPRWRRTDRSPDRLPRATPTPIS